MDKAQVPRLQRTETRSADAIEQARVKNEDFDLNSTFFRKLARDYCTGSILPEVDADKLILGKQAYLSLANDLIEHRRGKKKIKPCAVAPENCEMPVFGTRLRLNRFYEEIIYLNALFGSDGIKIEVKDQAASLRLPPEAKGQYFAMSVSDQCIMVGDFVGSQPNGYALCQSSTETRVGPWAAGQRHGWGSDFFQATGTQANGYVDHRDNDGRSASLYCQGTRLSWGVQKYADGSGFYEGQLFEGKTRQGRGVHHNAKNGNIYYGTFRNGLYDDEKGRIKFSNGTTVQGRFQRGALHIYSLCVVESPQNSLPPAFLSIAEKKLIPSELPAVE